MKKQLLKILGCLTVVAFTSQASASLLIEPYIGYLAGKTTSDSTGGGQVESDNESGTSLGARVGYELPVLNFSLGIDYQMGTLDDDDLNSLGVFVGYEFPILLRVYGEYLVSSKLDNGNEFEGGGYKLGVGLTTFPLVAINLEYIVHDYKNINGNDFPSGGLDDAKLDAYMLSVSLPLSL